MHSIYAEDYEKPMIEQFMQKQVMNGSVVPMIEKPNHDDIQKKVKEWRDIFYQGEKLSNYEKDLERQYILEKQQKSFKFSETNSMRYKVNWTISDLNRLQEQRDYRMNDEEYFGLVRPTFEPYDLDAAMDCMDIHHDINQTNRFRRWWSNYQDTKTLERGEQRSQMQAAAIL